jgi:hypothetical protein
MMIVQTVGVRTYLLSGRSDFDDNKDSDGHNDYRMPAGYYYRNDSSNWQGQGAIWGCLAA